MTAKTWTETKTIGGAETMVIHLDGYQIQYNTTPLLFGPHKTKFAASKTGDCATICAWFDTADEAKNYAESLI